jgi:hypothetical protein
MTSKEVQRELLALYRGKGITCKITAVPDGCWIYMGADSGMNKLFVNAVDYTKDPKFTIESYLKECDPRLS